MIKSKKDKKGSFEFNTPEETKTFANKEEKKIAKKIGGKQTINSGAIPFMPGDIYLGNYLIDVKSAKTSKQIIVSEDMLRKLEDDAGVEGKNPVLFLNFPNCEKLKNKQWVLLPVAEKKL